MNYEELNPGIRETVRLLVTAGYETCDSGDGETHEFACDREEGYVVIQLPDTADLILETEKVAELLEGNGYDLTEVIVQGTFVAGGPKLVDVHGIHDQLRGVLHGEGDER